MVLVKKREHTLIVPCLIERMTAQVLRHPHFLLVTLVLCNAAATEVRCQMSLSSLGVLQ